MRITWDAKAKAMYIYLVEEKTPSQETIKVDGYDEVYLDYDREHNLLGIEILNVEREPEIVKLGL